LGPALLYGHLTVVNGFVWKVLSAGNTLLTAIFTTAPMSSDQMSSDHI